MTQRPTPPADAPVELSEQQRTILLKAAIRDILTTIISSDAQANFLWENGRATYSRHKIAGDLLKEYEPYFTSCSTAQAKELVAQFTPPLDFETARAHVQEWRTQLQHARTNLGDSITRCSQKTFVSKEDAAMIEKLDDAVGAIQRIDSNMLQVTDHITRLERLRANPETKKTPADHLQRLDAVHEQRLAMDKDIIQALDRVHSDLSKLVRIDLMQLDQHPELPKLHEACSGLQKNVVKSMDKEIKGIYMLVVRELAEIKIDARLTNAEARSSQKK